MATVCPIKNLDGSINFDYTVRDVYLVSDHSYGAVYKDDVVVRCDKVEDAIDFLRVLYAQHENVITLSVREG